MGRVIAAIIFFLIGSVLISITTEKEISPIENLFEDQTLNTGESYDYQKKQISFGENIAPPSVAGNATESGNLPFNFYVFDPSNFELWRTGRDYQAYVSFINEGWGYGFYFIPDVKGDYYFVVGTPEPPIERIVTLTAKLTWQGKEIERPYLWYGIFAFIIGFAIIGISIPFLR